MASARANWADDEEFDDPNVLPPQSITQNPDGTKTLVSWRFADNGKKIKTTRKIRTIVHKEHVNPRVALRKEWPKFGLEKGHAPGPDLSTTTVGENIIFRPSTNWRAREKEEEKDDSGLRDQLKDKQVACRICKGTHFTARCPFKDTMPPLDDTGAPDTGEGPDVGAGGGGGGIGGSYVPPHLRGKGRGAGEQMGGKYERDDLATLRVTSVSETADEDELRTLFGRFGRVTRVFLAKDRDTGRAKGFAFISFADRSDAARACEKMNGFGYQHLILSVEFATKKT